jgi:UDP-N-acetyl-D-mannosaminuronate dehydrogenase
VIAVPTPFSGDHDADLSYITAAAEAIADVLPGGEVIVLESTAPPGTTRRVSELIVTGAASAEMAKLAENAYRDVNIAFANELSLICQHLGLDVWEIRQMANHHPRVEILRPGPGVSGHCIAVDPWFIVEAAPDLARLTRSAREVNAHAIAESDVIALLVDHSCFRSIKKTQLAGKVVYDTRGMWG